jgi:hypothetical protein
MCDFEFEVWVVEIKPGEGPSEICSKRRICGIKFPNFNGNWKSLILFCRLDPIKLSTLHMEDQEDKNEGKDFHPKRF